MFIISEKERKKTDKDKIERGSRIIRINEILIWISFAASDVILVIEGKYHLHSRVK